MNGKRRKQYKPRPTCLSDEALKEIANYLSKRFYRYGEIQQYAAQYGFRGETLTLLNNLESHGYLIASEEVPGRMCLVLYRVMTPKVYEEIEKEHQENAKRRLLAAVSY